MRTNDAIGPEFVLHKMPTSVRNKATVVVTTGDPAGIGSEVTHKALKHPSIRNKAKYIVIGNCVKWRGKLGRPSASGGRIAIGSVREAVDILNSIKGRKALVTAPASKYSLIKAGFRSGGHTELLMRLTHTRNAAMMFCAGAFRLVLLTRHVPLSSVPKLVTSGNLINTSTLFYSALKKYFLIKNPKIGIAGLNPHAGESGSIGDEEKRVIEPAIKQIRRKCRAVFVLRPADVLFRQLYKRKIDGIVCMYHDQGLGPFKMLFFDKGVNVTLGLPFIRTSPDHGTAFDIAGKGRANALSMIEAIKLAVKLA